MRSRDPYEILGVPPEATDAEIRSAFREKVRASHPDTTSTPDGDGDVIAVVEAYRQLMGSGAVARSPDPRETGSKRRVEVRRVPTDRPEAPAGVRCPGCRGAGVVELRSACPDCGGSGRITRLEAHRARVEPCRRCRGRGGGLHHDVCTVCRGSGRVTKAGE